MRKNNRKFSEFSLNFVFRAVQKNAVLVDLEKQLQNEYLVAKIGFDPAENEPDKVWSGSSGVPSPRLEPSPECVTPA